MLLTGCFNRALDEKLRVAIPKRVRTALGCPEGQPGAVYVAPGMDDSLEIYSEAAFERWAERLSGVSPTRPDVRAFARLFFGETERVELDAQGRVRIPPNLATAAHLQKDVVLLGVRDHLELWATERWQAYRQAKRENYDGIAEAAFGDGRGSHAGGATDVAQGEQPPLV
jgi:MraZ protein